MKKILFILIFTIFSCTKDNTEIKNGYVVHLQISGVNSQKAYLHKFESSISTKFDSVIITADKAIFTGNIISPERFLLTVENVFGGKIIILNKDTIRITASKKNLTKAQALGSPINEELRIFQKDVERIYNKVDMLFPEIQRARLNNDAQKLKEVSNKMKRIDDEGIEFNIEYASKNPNSYVSAMILNDLSKRDSVNLKRIETTFNQFSKEVKQSADSKELKALLKHYK